VLLCAIIAVLWICIMPDIQAMPLTKDVDKDFQHSVLKADAGCTPKLSRKKSVANDYGTSVTEILSKRTPRSSCRSCSSSSWLCAVKKSSKTAKHVIENKKKVCCSQLDFDTTPFSKVVEYSGCHLSTDNIPIVISNGTNEATGPYCEIKTTSSHVKVFACYLQYTCNKVFV